MADNRMDIDTYRTADLINYTNEQNTNNLTNKLTNKQFDQQINQQQRKRCRWHKLMAAQLARAPTDTAPVETLFQIRAPMRKNDDYWIIN